MRLHDLFLHAAARWPDRVAIDVPPGEGRPAREETTYAGLAAAAADLAAALAAFVHGECVVAVFLRRDSAALYAAQLAVLEVGAAHVCIDPAVPDAHVAHVLRDSGAVAVVTTDELAGRCRAAGFPPERIVDVGASVGAAARPAPAPPAWLSDASLAYVIYTSGTTGKPKGVLIEHRGIVSLVRSGVERFGVGPGDRIAQGSSAAYDSSVEEIWLALASGATVVVLDDQAMRAGPDLVPFLRRERITVLCPPPTLLRAMDCADPARELPALRLCYAGGEAMPEDVAEVWSRAVWLENGYGPTECTVTVVRGRIVPGEPVTIGTPIEGHVARLLDERLEPVREGTAGELCLAGPGLARGYLGLPELTAQRFPTLPGIGRVYRTGDRARRLADGRLCFEGRLDAQVKLRGHRIELEAIESALAACEGVREAACCVQRHGLADTLCAFVVAEGPMPPAPAALDAALRAALPEPMVPARYGLLSALPRTIGGKIDRRALETAACDPLAAATPRSRPAPRTTAERAIADAIAACMPGVGEVGLDDDFFALGGDSLRAAQVVARLRRDGALVCIAVRDVYEARTVRALAARIGTRGTAKGRAPAAPSPRTGDAGSGPALLVLLGQTAWLAGVLVGAGTVAWLLGWVLLPWSLSSFGVAGTLAAAPVLGVALTVAHTLAAVWFAAAVKTVLIGRYEPGRFAVWGSFHLRHWIVVHAARLVPWDLLAGTVFQAAALRALGARVGARVDVHRDVDLAQGGWDLLEIGDDATLQRETAVLLVELDAGHWAVGPVRIGPRAVVETRAGMGPDTALGADAELSALSFLAPGERVPAGERWDGVPARPSGRSAEPAPVDVMDSVLPPWLHGALLVAARLVFHPATLAAVVLAVPTALGLRVTTAAVLDWLYVRGPLAEPRAVAFLVAALALALPLGLAAQAVLVRGLRKVPAGTHGRWSTHHLRLLVRTRLVESAGEWLSGTLFWPAWLRLAGMRVGRGTEISTILDALPEHVEIGAWSFLADGVYLGSPRQRAGAVTVRPTRLGARTFLGNHVVVPSGERLPDDVLLGVATVADGERMRSANGWFGHPPFPLPRREVIEAPRALTHAPGALRWTNRFAWEAARMVLPAGPALAALAWFHVLAHVPGTDDARVLLLAAVPLSTLGAGAALATLVLLAKWLLLGRVRPGQHGLWSCWASRWDFHYVLWHRWGRTLLAQFEGTGWLPWYLRAMGMRIGRRAVLGGGFAHVVDPDMIRIGDGATVHALFQAHSFEDRVLKIDRVDIGAFATVGRGAVVMYGARIGEGTRVAPHSVVMKHELLLPGRAYEGAPTAEVEPAPAPASERSGAQSRGPERDLALDVARGLAVLGMVLLHFVPDELPDGSALLALLHGRPAALFTLLAGMSWALQTERRAGGPGLGRHTLRRALSVGVVGFVFWRLLWPTEVLLPFACMLPIVVWLTTRGAGAVLLAIAALLVATPVAATCFGHWVDVDCLENGAHLANSEFGWTTLRYFVFDGSYPLVPWLALALFGAMLALRDRGDAATPRRWFLLALPLALAAVAWPALVPVLGDAAPELLPWAEPTWQPTTLPFLFQIGAAAVAVVGSLQWWDRAHGLPRVLRPLADVGRASLTHYLLHIAAVYAPMRWFWPDEDWSAPVGLVAAAGYAAFAVLVSRWWFRRWRRGPAEAIWAAASR